MARVLYAISVACVMAASAIGCREPTRPQPSISRTDSASIRSANARRQALDAPIDRHCQALPNVNCSVTYTAVPANYFCDGNGCLFSGLPEQRDPITTTFAKPIYRLIVEMNGRFYCSGTYGTVQVFNRIGTQVE